jgi:hypothetical protein
MGVVMVSESVGDAGEVDGCGELVGVYRHDVHKARLRSHEHAEREFRGVRVNEAVALGADGDAALLSRPRGDPEQTVPAHGSWLRVSLLSGEVVGGEAASESRRRRLRELVGREDPSGLHWAWLDAAVPGVYSESPYYPYTSLKYHTLLVAALLDNYRAGYEFEELSLVADASGAVIPHRTVLSVAGFSLHLTGDPDGKPGVGLGERPRRSWADVWSRLPAYPFEVEEAREWQVLDAQLRRIRSWSTALQFIEEFVAEWCSGPTGGVSDGGGVV